MSLTVSSDAGLYPLTEEAWNSGLNDPTRKYLLFVDDLEFECGTASMSLDNTKGDRNDANSKYLYAAVGRFCWGAKAATHELIHTLGGVQDDAPHSSHGWHCTDEHDLMCYSDMPMRPIMTYPCPSQADEYLLDCGRDDYFNVDPPGGSYLADYWNVADSLFLVKTDRMVWLAQIMN